jgi:hypothetical protein
VAVHAFAKGRGDLDLLAAELDLHGAPPLVLPHDAAWVDAPVPVGRRHITVVS